MGTGLGKWYITSDNTWLTPSDKFFKNFTNYRKKTNRVIVFSSRPLPIFLNTGTTNETFQTCIESSASTYESSGWQLFRTTTGIQSGPDAFDESRFVMTFLTILEGMEIWCRFRLVLEGKAGKEIPEASRLELLEKFLANNFVLSDAEDNIPRLLYRGVKADLPLLRTLLAVCQKSREPKVWEMIDSFVLVAYASLAASRTFLKQLLACLNLWFILLVQRKKWFLWTMTAAQAAENDGDDWGLTWYLWWDIHKSTPTWTHSQNSLAAAEGLSLKISSHGTSLKYHKDHPSQLRIE